MSKPGLLIVGAMTDRMRGQVTDAFTVHDPGTDRESVLGAHGDSIEYVLCAGGHTRVGGEMMDRMPNLKIISNFGVGYDAIDTDAAVARGIMVTHTPDVLNDEVANTALLLLLALARNYNHDEAWARSGDWETKGNAPLSRSIRGLTVGILGLGRIGETLAEKLGVFGVTIVYHNRSQKDVPYRYYGDLVAMARDADAIISVVPGSAATRHIVNAEVMEALGPRGMLVNIGRGSVVDEAALVEALQSGKLGGAALDVFEHEPKIPDALKSMPNTVLLPHVGSATVETRTAMGDLSVENLISFRDTGRAVTPVPECKGM